MWDSRNHMRTTTKVCTKTVYLITSVLPPSFSHPVSQQVGLSGDLAAAFSEDANDAASQESYRQSVYPPTDRNVSISRGLKKCLPNSCYPCKARSEVTTSFHRSVQKMIF